MGEAAHFSGTNEQDALEIRDKYFRAWNGLVLAERNKYKIEKMVKVSEIEVNISMVTKLNKAANIDSILVYDKTTVADPERLRNHIGNYDYGNLTGVGFMLVAVLYNKFEARGTYYFVLVDMDTKEILSMDRVRGSAKGFGFRNYWANTIYKIIPVTVKLRRGRLIR